MAAVVPMQGVGRGSVLGQVDGRFPEGLCPGLIWDVGCCPARGQYVL